MSKLAGKRVLLIVSGGIAAFKALELIRLLRRQGCAVTCVLTRNGAEFVTPLSLQALSESKVYTDLFSLTDRSEMGHIQLSRSADLLVVVPASADLLARMAAGMADDLASTVLLATDKPVLVAPAMNVRMWLHAATQSNMRLLESRGVHVVGPDEGAMACNEFGRGRMSEPAEILTAIRSHLAPATPSPVTALPLAGQHALVTSGPTHEPIDPVRYIANRSSGRQGHAIAAELAALGARVTLVSGPVSVPDQGCQCGAGRNRRGDAACLPGGIARRCSGVCRRGRRLAGGQHRGGQDQEAAWCRRAEPGTGAQPGYFGHHCRDRPHATTSGRGVRGGNRRSDGQCPGEIDPQERRLDCGKRRLPVDRHHGRGGERGAYHHRIRRRGLATGSQAAGRSSPRPTHRGLAALNATLPYRIRRLGAADVQPYRAVRLDALLRHPEVFGSSHEEEAQLDDAEFVRMISQPPSSTLGAFAGDELVGIAGLMVPVRQKQRHKGIIVGVYVAAEHRRTGVAQRLVEALIVEARQSSLRVVELAVTVGNQPARRLYYRLGFRTYGIERFALAINDSYLDEELMALMLD